MLFLGWLAYTLRAFSVGLSYSGWFFLLSLLTSNLIINSNFSSSSYYLLLLAGIGAGIDGRLFFLFPASHEYQYYDVHVFTGLSVNTKHVCLSLIIPYVNFHTNQHIQTKKLLASGMGGKKSRKLKTSENWNQINISTAKLLLGEHFNMVRTTIDHFLKIRTIFQTRGLPGLTSIHRKCLPYNSIHQIKCMEKMLVIKFSYNFEKW